MIMKKLYTILFSAAALLAFAPAVSAQVDYSINGQIKDPKTGAILTWPKDNGLHTASDFAYSKDISAPQTDGTYWIKLESFSTGSASYIEAAVPADILLVLDLSTSMRASRGTTTQVTTAKGLSYNDVVNARTAETNYLYRNGNNSNDNKYQLFAEENNGRYYLYYNASGSNNKNYLTSATSTSTNRNNAVYATSETGAIVNFPASGRLYTGSSRIFALKDAVAAFIDEINTNDLQKGDGTRIGNRLSLITFTSAATPHQKLVSLTDANVTSLKQTVWNFSLTTGTRPDLGLEAANDELDGKVTEGRTRTVIVFTDGEPYVNGSISYDEGIEAALPTKTTYDANVYTIGMFSSTLSPSNNTYKFMNYMSSNYPDAEDFDNPGDGSDKGFFYDVSDPNYDLTKVFTEIAHQSGGSTTSLSAASSNVDVVSHSFMLPEGTDSDNIASVVKIFVAKLEKIENGKYVFYKEILAGHTPDDYIYYELDENGERISDTPKKVDATLSVKLEGKDKIKVTGFDYSSNFCGPVYKLNEPTVVDHYQGYKIIIMIPIKMNPDAVGGPDINTNGAGSGIFVKEGDATAFVPYESPTVSLPVNIYITKKGLKGGESAKFMIERATLPKSGPVVYSELTWTYVSTVFVTKSKGSTTDPIVYVRGLPANQDVVIGEGDSATTEHRSFVYRISEENWSWSYTPNTPPQYTDTENIDNPFTFSNTPIENIDVKVRHAESKATNIFKPGVVEGNVIYDDSKTNTRTKTNTNTTE